jgi:hypothetical protein
MKTDDLIGMLATGAGAAEPAGDGRRMALALVLSVPVMVLAVAQVLGLLPVSGWLASATIPKLAYGLTVALLAAWLLRQAGRPGAGTGLPVALLAVLAAAVLAAGTWDVVRLPPEARLMQITGKSWTVCPAMILALSLPLVAGFLWAARRLAPVRPGLAGTAAGLAAGGVGTAAYALHCDEGAMAFVALWYSLGMVASGLLGGLLGARLLRW